MASLVQPRNFSWFVENKVAGMGWPSAESFPFLAESCGIKVLVNLTENNPPAYHDVALSHGIRCVHVHILAYSAPTMTQIEEVIALIEREASAGQCAVGIHCFMGKGRTGTMLACYLVEKEGLSAASAIEETRRRRKGSIETDEQEQTVRDYESYLKRK